MASHLAQAQWTTLDAFQLASGFSSVGAGLGTNEFGDVVAVGSGVADSSENTVAVARQSTDLGQSWETSSSVTYSGASSCTFRAVANYGQTLYAAASEDAGGVVSWQVVQSLDGGNTWQTSDSLTHASCMAVAADRSGNVFAAGSITVNGYVYGIIRKLAVGGSAWSTVYQGSAAGSFDLGIAFGPMAEVFAIGSMPTGTRSAWAVLKSPDGGSTWGVADLYLAGSMGRGIAVDTQGRVYATGFAGNYWVTRRSVDGGTTWNTVDSFQYSTNGKSEGESVTFDYQGNVYVAGNAGAGKQGYYWVVRELPAGASSWRNCDVFQFFPGGATWPSFFSGATLSANGGHVVLVTGMAADSSNVDHWLTRRLVVP